MMMSRLPMHTSYLNFIPSHSSATERRSILRHSRKETTGCRLFIKMIILVVLIASISGCSRQTKHEVLTFFFTGVPPLEEEKKAETKEGKAGEIPTTEKKVVSKAKLFSHTPYRLRMCDQCHRTSAYFGRFRKKGPPRTVSTGRGSAGLLVVPLKELCVKCHKYMSTSSVFKEGLWLHAPAAQGNCTICHGPHQTEYPNVLLVKLDKMCTQCHSEGFMMDSADHRKSTECLSCHNQLLQGEGANALVVAGIGMRPLVGFRNVGIQVMVGPGERVSDVLEAYLAGTVRPIDDGDVCGGHTQG